jgi:hypothetical protein
VVAALNCKAVPVTRINATCNPKRICFLQRLAI